MDWKGEFLIDETWMIYRGRAADNHLHAHASLQLSVALAHPVSIGDEYEATTTGNAVCVKAGVKHILHPIEEVVLLFVEPQSNLARTILLHADDEQVSPVEDKFISQFNWNDKIDRLAHRVRTSAIQHANVDIDARLETALEFLRTAELRGAISKAAKISGVSEPRLRAIAQSTMGVPLSKWLTWQAVRRAAEALSNGASLASAAATAGFADQAHYTRMMRQLMGITPMMAAKAILKVK